MMTLYTSSAGIAGDPHKLLVLEGTGKYKDSELYSTWSFLNWEYYWAVYKLIKRYRSHEIF